MNLQVGVKAFLRGPDGKFLLVKRSSEKYKNTKGTWDIIGGRIEPGAALLENLKREIKEETQLDLVSEPKLMYAQDIIPEGGERHIVRLSYVADISGEPILDITENVEYVWLSLDELKKQDDLDVYVKEILEKGLLS
jgi:8-oxo-dGTP pyrophosphatase MutT (NUDIX family)